MSAAMLALTIRVREGERVTHAHTGTRADLLLERSAALTRHQLVTLMKRKENH